VDNITITKQQKHFILVNSNTPFTKSIAHHSEL